MDRMGLENEIFMRPSWYIMIPFYTRLDRWDLTIHRFCQTRIPYSCFAHMEQFFVSTTLTRSTVVRLLESCVFVLNMSSFWSSSNLLGVIIQKIAPVIFPTKHTKHERCVLFLPFNTKNMLNKNRSCIKYWWNLQKRRTHWIVSHTWPTFGDVL